MAFEVPKTGYQQIDPTFNPGRSYPNKYHNVGQLQTPYQGKPMGQVGDYGPVQSTVYYQPTNTNYPYVMDKDFRAVGYMPGNACSFNHPGYSPVYESSYPERFVPPNYFSPSLQHPSGKAKTDQAYGMRVYDAMLRAYKPYDDYDAHDPQIFDYTKYEQAAESQQTNRENYEKLRTAHKNMSGSTNFFPFN